MQTEALVLVSGSIGKEETLRLCLRDTMGAVLSWFTTHLCVLMLDTADALKHWRVSKTLTLKDFIEELCTRGNNICHFY